MTKIESRPLKTALGEYFFIIDIDNEQKKLADFAYQELTSLGITYKFLVATVVSDSGQVVIDWRREKKPENLSHHEQLRLDYLYKNIII